VPIKMNIYRKIASDISPTLLDRRYSARRFVNIEIFLITALGNIIPATARDVSSRGFRVKADYGVTIGRPIVLVIPGLSNYPGWVAWSYLGEFGVEGAEVISDHVIDYIVNIDQKLNF
jgi:hypothetical protein